MDNTPMINAPSWWKKPEGRTGKVVLVIGFAAAAWAILSHIDQLIALCQKTIYFAVLCGVIALIIALVSDRKFRNLCGFVYRSLMRAITGIVVELNPIAILEDYVSELKVKLQKIDDQLTLLKGQIGKVARKIDERKSECQHEFDMADIAKKKGLLPAEIASHAMKGERLKGYIQKLQDLYNKMQFLYEFLSKMRKYSDLMIQNTDFEVQLQKDEYESIVKSHNVMKTAFNIINGNDDKKLLFDQAMDYTNDQMGSKIGEMERMMEASMSFISTADLENGVYEDKGLKILEEFDQKGMEALFSINGKSLPEHSTYEPITAQDTHLIETMTGTKTTSNKYFN